MQRTCQRDGSAGRGLPASPGVSWPRSAVLCLLMVGAWLGCSHAAGAKEPKEPKEPSHALIAGARQWVAEQRGTRAEAVNLGDLDARLKVPACNDRNGWQYDFPSAQQQSVRARCAQPVAQFFLKVNLSSPGSTSSLSRATGVQEARQSRPVVVLRQGLLRGTRLTADHLEQLEWPAANVPLQSIDNVANAINAELTQDLLAGKPIRSTDLRPALLVKRGQTVTLTIRQEGGFAVAALVEALQDGRKDDSIRLKNPESGRILTGKVVGLYSVEGQ